MILGLPPTVSVNALVLKSVVAEFCNNKLVLVPVIALILVAALCVLVNGLVYTAAFFTILKLLISAPPFTTAYPDNGLIL